MSNISVDYDILNQKQTPAFYASSLATRPAFGFPGRIFIDTDTPSSGIYRDTGSAWVQVADPGAGTTGTLQQVTTNGNTTTLGISVQGIEINDGAGTGVYNLAVGNSALALNTNGEYNLAIGQNALNKNTTGQSNIAIGYVSLQNNIGGNGNTAIGNSALQTNSNGVSNTAIGFNALLSNTTGNNNTAIGVSSLALNTTGANNIAVGSSSLYANTTGGANTGIGYASLSANTTGGNNTSLGSQALKENTTASFNTAIGTASLQNNTTGASNTAIGYGSLNINTTGSTNTAVGTSALASNTTAGQNTAVGNSSMSANTTGSLNTAVGQGSMQANTTGQYNTAVGTTSLNTNTTGINNTAVGYGALQLLTIGGGNVAIGYGSGGAITTGNNNYLLGGGQAITTGSHNTIIGSYGGTSTLANNIVLSDGQSNVRLFSDANGLIGINQAVGSVPGGQLDIHTTQTYALVLNGLSTSNAYTAFSNASVGKWRIGNTYNAGANSFDIYNLGTSSTALSFNSTTNAATFIAGIGIGNASASTGGIQFPATQVDIANANNLDDYEEGEWTPLLTGGTSGQATSGGNTYGFYTKIGRLVTLNFVISLSSVNTLSGNVFLSSLPFSLASGGLQNRYPQGAILFSSLSTLWCCVIIGSDGNTTKLAFVGVKTTASTGEVSLTNLDLSNSTVLAGSIEYIAA